MKYKKVVVTKRGGPEVLKVIEEYLTQPSPSQVRIRVLAAPVTLPDVEARYGRTPFPPKIPFVPGYAAIGDVDAVGKGVTSAKVGDRVAALTAYGGYSEYMYLRERQLVPVPTSVDPGEAIPLLLNYIVAYQSLHRSAKVKAGDRVLIIGASGGIGTAFLQLGKLVNLTMYGIASKNKHPILTEYGARAIDYHTQDFVEVIREMEPVGLDAVFDGIGGEYISRGFSLLRRGGVYVGYANPLSLFRTIRFMGQVVLFNFWSNGKTAKYYSTGKSRLNPKPFLEDWSKLFRMLEEGSIRPVIAERFPILEAAKANELLEGGQVIGNIVLLAPELL